MTRLGRMSITATLLILAGTFAAAAPEAGNKAPGLSTIAKLSGSWTPLDEDGKPVKDGVHSWQVTAAGKTVVERIFAGTDHEMQTMYYQNGADLLLTHYCVEGNQPTMRARRDTGPDRIVFECIGGTNLESENERHMHQGIITILDEDHVKTEWLLYENGKNTYTARMNLIRSGK